tara:strand:- start:114 stop:260 length:147 start_codon:yes stop_codon:yes gene_type:complete
MIIPLVFPNVGAIDWQRVGSWVFTEWLAVLVGHCLKRIISKLLRLGNG